MQKFIAALLLVLTFTACSKKASAPLEPKVRQTYNNKALALGELNFMAPGSWQEQDPSNPMRVAEFVVDPTTQTLLKVYKFPMIDDLVAANLNRWRNQFETGAIETENKQFNVNNIPVTVFQMSGTYLKAESMRDPNSKKTRLEEHTMLAVIAETKESAWFFKMTAPDDLVDAQEEKINKFIDSIKISES